MKHIKCYDLLLEPLEVKYDAISSFKLSGPEPLVKLINEIYKLNKLNRELAIVAGFNAAGYLTGLHQVSIGQVSSTSIAPDQIFKFLLLTNSTMFIMLHNHPSGTATPSKEDQMGTIKLRECGKYFDIQMLDHIIVTHNDYTSIKQSTTIFDVN